MKNQLEEQMNALDIEAGRDAYEYSNRMWKDAQASDLQLACCEEDFSAGYMTAAAKYKADLEIAIGQLKQILDLSRAQREPYSTAVARYTLAKLGVLK